MTRRQMLFAPAALALSSYAAKRRNVVLLLADDLGYADLSCYGSTDIETPHLDALADRGLRFRNFYAASAVCSPSRAAILTGRSPLRFDIRSAFRDGPEYLPATHTTLPKLLRDAGYATMHIGKWHLGGLHPEHCVRGPELPPGPMQHGFDEYLCMYETPPVRAELLKRRLLYREGTRHLVRSDRAEPLTWEHWEQRKADEACRFIEKNARAVKPFYLNLWFDAPHTPYEPAPEPHLSKHQGKATGDALLYRSMVSHMDASIGCVVGTLERYGIEKDTLIIFTSDNGPSHQGSTGGHRGRKGDLHDGGLRVPAIAACPAFVRRGVSDALAHHTDLLPTICAAAAIRQTSPLDGLDLSAHLATGAELPADRWLFWQMDLLRTDWQSGDGPVPYQKPAPYATEAVRYGPWKLLARDGVPTELFNLHDDPGETTNRLAHQPALASRMTARLRDWLNEPRDRSWRERSATD